MKVKEIAQKHGLDLIDFDRFLMQSIKYQSYYSSGFIGSQLQDDMVLQAVDDFQKWQKLENMSKEEKLEVERLKAIERREYNAELSQILITSGFNFDGYTITKYSGYISGDDIVSVNRRNVYDGMLDALVVIRRKALQELKEAAYDLGCNAVIGVDFDYFTLDPEKANIITGSTTYQPYIFGVTANGNAVVIEKNE